MQFKLTNTLGPYLALIVTGGLLSGCANAQSNSDDVIAKQRASLEANTAGKGFGPQSPRDISQVYGTNQRIFGKAPHRSQMELCNIHFHKFAEHKGGEFTTYAGKGNGEGINTGYQWNGRLSDAQMKPVDRQVCAAKGPGQALNVGDTVEVHWVHSSSEIEPGATLSACLDEDNMNPALRVEAQVIVLANDENALGFSELAEVEEINGYDQAPNIPMNTGQPVEYLGSTTGPKYNEQGSAIKVTWSVRPQVAVVDINSVANWCDDNIFNENYGHKVRNLVTNHKLLSPIR
ncbi:delta-class carbonic anhydrase [Alteromonas halophila]|uniref:Cadmium carbonic anhydrase n=1 Tax=Alteromonas halophila TaxID=516698 RepID=A0A918MXL2_9ALTE|nr:delta-class carbonic anhydrase [Alteromonas halophila]GGW82810.1 hypothetical protein GCM10007391_14940 [Alteromonas halophila]